MIQGPDVPSALPMPAMDPGLVPGAVVTIVVCSLIAAIIILWPIMRALARRLEGKAAPPTASLRAEVDQIEHRLAEVDALQARVAELEERVDFAERLLTRAQDAPAPALRGDKK